MVTVPKSVAFFAGAVLLLAGFTSGFFVGKLVQGDLPKEEPTPPPNDFPLTGFVRFQKPGGELAPATEANMYLIDASELLGSKWQEVLQQAEARQARTTSANDSPSSDVEFFRRALSALVREKTIRTRCNAAGEFSLRAQPGFYYLVASGRAANIDAIWSTRILEVPHPEPILLELPVASSPAR